MLTFVTWLWKPQPGYRSAFTAESVNVLRAMVVRHYARPHRFLCVTDERKGIDPRVDVIPAWNDYQDLPPPQGGHNPSCYRRLRMYHPEIGQTFGPRFVSLDLDCVVTGDLVPLFDRPDEFVIWGDTNRNTHYNGGLVLMNAGCRAKVWTAFDPKVSPHKAKVAKCFGSDQAWISYCLGPGETKWTKADGVYSYRNDIERSGHLPDNARLVMFHGKHDPWSERPQRLPWVRQHYRDEGAYACSA